MCHPWGCAPFQGLLWFLECVDGDPTVKVALIRIERFMLDVPGVADDLASQGAELRHKIYHLGV
nr:MAG TPA: hypothetical protein [Caudoviricetes sp.]